MNYATLNPIVQSPTYADIRVHELSAHTGARIIDVRELDEYFGPLGHIDGAEHVPLAHVEAAARRWRRDERLVLVCHSGRRSAQAALWLCQQGFTQVANLQGGMVAYRQAMVD